MKNKLIGLIAIVAAVGLVACGGGDGGSTGTSGTPPAKSTQTSQAMNNFNSAVQILQAQIAATQAVPTMSASKVVTTLNFGDVECSWTDFSYTCSIVDGHGGSCAISGNWNQSEYFWSLDFDCDNFGVYDGETLQYMWNGLITYGLKFQQYNYPTSSAMASAVGLKSVTPAGCADVGALVNDICGQSVAYDGTECVITCDTLECTSANAILLVDWVVGSEGFNITDFVCTTDPAGWLFRFDPGFEFNGRFCMPEMTTYVISYDTQGTINGEEFPLVMNTTCTYTF